ncbi:MAG TPA: BamA/TamA family outer membrane protein [Methylomirabilota bacterium]|nr:BamA/TamA family outer membrane protein [Methylomirabilota bacterium]
MRGESPRHPWRRRLAVAAAVVAVLVAVLLVALSVPAVQRALWDLAVARATRGSAWSLTADEVGWSLPGGSFGAAGLELAHDGTTVATADGVEAEWDWLDLVTAPRRIERLEVTSGTLDLDALPEPTGADEPAPAGDRLLPGLEVASARIGLDRLHWSAPGVAALEVRDAVVTGSLSDGRVDAEAEAAAVVVRREGRTLEAREVSASARVDRAAVAVTRLESAGGDVVVDVSGDVGLGDDPSLSSDLEAAVGLADLARWWDPTLAGQLEPRGRLELAGTVGWSAGSGMDGGLEHVGEPLEVAGYPIRSAELAAVEAGLRVEAASPAWGFVRATLRDDRRVRVEGSFDDADPRAAARRAPQPVAAGLPPDLQVSGEVDLLLPPPPDLLDPAAVEGEADLTATWSGGELSLEAGTTPDGVRFRAVTLEVPGGRLEADGVVTDDGGLDAEVGARIEEPARVVAALSPWLPGAVADLPVSGGPVALDLRAEGPLATPRIDARLEWQDPAYGALSATLLEVTAEGSAEELTWTLFLRLAGDARLAAEGSARPVEAAVAGRWRLVAGPAPAGEPAELGVGGLTAARMQGRGRFEWRGSVGRATATVVADDLGSGPWRLDGLVAEAELADNRLELDRLVARGFGGSLRASASLPLAGEDALTARLDVAGLDPAALPLDLPEAAAGEVDGYLEVGGPAASPDGELRLRWRPAPGRRPLPPLVLSGAVADGWLRLGVEPTEVAGGELEATVSVPLGGLPLPEWLWPEAPSGPVTADARVRDLRLEPVLALLGTGDVPVDVSGDLRVAATWSPSPDGERSLRVSLGDLVAESTQERLTSAEPISLVWADGLVRLEDAVLEGPVSRVRASGELDLDRDAVELDLEAVVGPSWLRLVPGDLDATGPVAATLRFEGTLGDLDGRLELDQIGGEIMVSDPPVQIAGAELDLELDDGVWSVAGGSATVNRGTVLMGGEWNPETGQGVIFELSDVVFLTDEGILSRWDGLVVVEPAEDRVARLVGELELTSGRWDGNVDLAAAVLGGDEVEVGTTAPLLLDVALDLEVLGRGAVVVDNNLGEFEVTWYVLDVEGTAAQPRVEGELFLVPGGVISLSGRQLEIARGTIRLSGEPGVEPEVEVVPLRTAHTFGGREGSTIDAADLAGRGIASSVGSALGLRNESLQPATIAVETLTDPSTNYLLSRQIGRHVALFVSAGLSDVQERAMMMQLYNFRALPGLALQAIDDTRTGAGFAAIERFRWGGTVEERPRVRRVELAGDWPLPERRLRKAVGIERGQVFDPFLVFAGRVRLERELERAGFYRARVAGWADDDEELVKLSFSVDPGPRQEVVFRGDELPEAARRAAVAEYRPTPMEAAAFEEMTGTVREHLDARGRPFAEVEVVRDGELVVVTTDRGREVELAGPALHGVADDAAAALADRLSTPADLAVLAREADDAVRRVERLLELEGYLRPRVVEVRLEELEAGRSRVHVEIEHSGRATIATFDIEGEDPLDAADPDELPIEVGMPLRRGDLEAAERQLEDVYRRAAYTDVEVATEVEGEGEDRRVTVTVEPGPRRRIGEIRIRGRRHLGETVVTKGLEVEEGDLLQRDQINESIVQLASFAPIARVDLEQEVVGVREVDLDIRITERERWTAGAGVRWSGDTGLLGLVDLRDDGLFSRGFSLDLRGLYGSDRQAWALVGSLPRPPGGRWSTSLTVSYRDLPSRTDPERLQEEGRGASVEATRRFDDRLSMRGYYLWEDIVSSRSSPGQDPTTPDRAVVLSTLGWQAVYDRLDDPFDPRSGLYLAADVGWSSPSLGGDVSAIRTLLTATWATEPVRRWTWARTFRVGWAEPLDDRPLAEPVRLFAGGQSSVRGFELDLVGPVVDGPEGELLPLGGGALAVLNEEIRIPVYTHDTLGVFRIAVFADVGQVWPSWSAADLELAVGAGVGLRWSSPLGPVWVDVAWPVAEVQGDSGAKFYFGLGRPF